MLKARLGLEGLEAREVPAIFTWLGGNAGDPLLPLGDPTSAANPRNWSAAFASGPFDSETPHGQPWTGDTVRIDTSTYDCVGLIVYDGGAFGSLAITGTGGTVSFGAAIATGLFSMSGGAIAQDSTENLTVSDTFTWTGGTLNNAASTSAVNLVGASATIAPGTGNSLTTGSTLNLLPAASGAGGTTAWLADGTINFANNASVLIDNMSTFNIGANQPGQQPQRPVSKFEVAGPNPFGAQQVQVLLGGSLTITQGDFTSNNLPLDLSGGELKVIGGDSTAKFGGRVAAFGNNGPSIQMSDGAIRLMQGTTLTAVNGITLSKGTAATSSATLSTLWNPFAPANQRQPQATIVGDVKNSGADVGMCSDKTNRLAFGDLYVDGTVEWSGGTFIPMVYAPGGNLLLADRWMSKKEFIVKAGAKLGPATVNAQGQFAVQQPVVGEQWIIIFSQDKVTVNQVPPVAGKWKVILELDARANVVTKFKIEGIP